MPNVCDVEYDLFFFTYYISLAIAILYVFVCPLPIFFLFFLLAIIVSLYPFFIFLSSLKNTYVLIFASFLTTVPTYVLALC